MSPQAIRTDRTAGVILVVIGAGLFLYSIGAVPFDVLSAGVWLALGVTGMIMTVKGWKHRSSVLLFTGGFLFVAGVHTALWSVGVLEARIEELLPAFFLWIGLASLFVWLPNPYKVDLLIPAVLFGGSGLGYYLWWWDVVRMSELKHAISQSWPVLIILLGLGILLRSLFRSPRNHV